MMEPPWSGSGGRYRGGTGEEFSRLQPARSAHRPAAKTLRSGNEGIALTPTCSRKLGACNGAEQHVCWWLLQRASLGAASMMEPPLGQVLGVATGG
jgi:hypothetical protein